MQQPSTFSQKEVININSKYICIKNVSREFDEFGVKSHLCKLRCWYLKYTTGWVSFFIGTGPILILFFNIGLYRLLVYVLFLSTTTGSVRIFTFN